MKKAFATKLALIATALLLTAGTASAKDVDGKFGVGFSQSISGTSGLGLNYWVGNFKIGGGLGVDMFLPKDGDGTTNLGFHLHGLYAIARAQNVNLNLGLRVNLWYADPGAADSITTFGVEIPIEVEYWFDDHFSITGHTGIIFDIIGDKGDASGKGRGEGSAIGIGNGDFSGGVGFNFYF